MKKSVSFLLAAATISFGFEFQPLGYTSVGMGGAGVASARGSLGLYYNPALLAKHRYKAEFSLGVGIGYRENNLVDRIDKLANQDELSDTIDHIADNAPVTGSNRAEGYDKKMEDALYQLSLLSKGNGVSIQPTAEFAGQVGPVGIGVFGIGDLTAQAVVDPTHLKVIVKDDDNNQYYYYKPEEDAYLLSNKDDYNQYSLEYALDNNLTYIDIRGILVKEVPIGYAQTFDINNFNVSVGGSLKYIQGDSYKNKIAIDTDSDDLDDSLDDNSKTSNAVGVDLGVLVSYEKVDLGLVGKYLNAPKLKYYDGSEYKIKPMVRAGLNFEPKDWIQIAFDMDLTKNDTAIKNYKSQYVGGGINFHQSWFSIRAGAMKNIAENQEGTILTAGLGLGLKWFQFDLAAQLSTKDSTYKDDKIPRYAKINLAIVSRW